MSSTWSAATAETRSEDARRSVNQWMTSNLLTLQHKCNAYHLSEIGKKLELAKRLFHYFNKDSSSSEESTPSPHSSDSEEKYDFRRNAVTPPRVPSGLEDGEIVSGDGDALDPDAREMQSILNYETPDNFSDDENKKRKHSPSKSPPRLAPPTLPSSTTASSKVTHNGGNQPGNQSKRATKNDKPISARIDGDDPITQNAGSAGKSDVKNGDGNNDNAKYDLLTHEIKAMRSQLKHVKLRNDYLENKLDKHTSRTSSNTNKKVGKRPSDQRQRQRSKSPSTSPTPKRARKSKSPTIKTSTRDHRSHRSHRDTSQQKLKTKTQKSTQSNDQNYQQQLQAALSQSQQLSQQLMQQQQQQLQVANNPVPTNPAPTQQQQQQLQAANNPVPTNPAAVPSSSIIPSQQVQTGMNSSSPNPGASFPNPFTPPPPPKNLKQNLKRGHDLFEKDREDVISLKKRIKSPLKGKQTAGKKRNRKAAFLNLDEEEDEESPKRTRRQTRSETRDQEDTRNSNQANFQGGF